MPARTLLPFDLKSYTWSPLTRLRPHSMPYWPFNATSKADDAAGQPQSWLSYLALPSLSSLPQIALPNARNLQRSVIRYLINRTLGAYFNIGHDGPDSQDIDADFANGQANLNKVSLRVDVGERCCRNVYIKQADA